MGKVCFSRGTHQKDKQIISVGFRVTFDGGWGVVLWNHRAEDILANIVDN